MVWDRSIRIPGEPQSSTELTTALVYKMPLRRRLKKRLIKYRRRLFESFDSHRYSRPALNGIDHKLQKYLSYTDGFFVEAGANDGFAQSNTYYLERFLGWHGILVEPIPELYERCVRERPNSTVFNCALVSDDYEGETVKMLYSGLMSLVEGAMKGTAADLEHVQRGMQVQGLERSYQIEVPARTLTSILDEVGAEGVDFVSLDVEGYELSVLKGFDLDRAQPTYLLIEARFRQEIEAHLLKYGYVAIDQFSAQDVLYARRSQ